MGSLAAVRGSLREKAPEVWELRVYVGVDPVTGKKRTLSRTFRGGKRAANKELARLVTEYGGQGVATEKTFGELLERRLDAVERRGASPTTVDSYRSKARHLTRLADVRLDRLTGQTLDDLYRDLQTDGVRPPTVRECHALIRATLNQGIRWGWCERNVAMMATPPRAQHKQVAVPSVADALAAFEDAESTNPEMATFLRLATATGARRGELCALRWTDVDLEAGTLHIQRSIAQVGQQTFEKSTKTHQSRLVPIGPGTVRRLITHRTTMIERAAVCEIDYLDDAFLFSNEPDGSASWLPKRITLAWIRLRARHGLDGIKLHALRHLAVSAMLDAGVPVRDVADMVGHLDTRTTSIYTHGNEKRRRQAAMVMDELIAGE